MSVPDTTVVTTAVVDLIASATSRPIGDADLPTAADPPFAVVYLLPGGDTWGPDYIDPHAAAALVYQVTSVAVRRNDAESFADIVRHALLDRDGDGRFVNQMPVADHVVLDRELISFGGIDSERGVYNVRDTYQIHVTRP